MQLGMIGLGRMGANMVKRLMKDGHECVVYDVNADSVTSLANTGATGTTSLADFVAKLTKPRAAWVMVPAAVTEETVYQLGDLMDADDIIIDGGNSYYKDDIKRAAHLKRNNIHYIDAGTSGGVWGLERGYCLMIGGESGPVSHLDPIFKSIAPGMGSIERTRGRTGEPSPSELGYLHCGPNGAGHFVKMVHNGIEYGLMACYGEGLDILRNADVDTRPVTEDAETAPRMADQDLHFKIDTREVAEVWRRGSVISSWLLDLTADALFENPDLTDFTGRISDSGEGRWTAIAAIQEGTPAPLLTTALFDRFRSQQDHTFGEKIQSAQRFEFGGHHEKLSPS